MVLLMKRTLTHPDAKAVPKKGGTRVEADHHPIPSITTNEHPSINRKNPSNLGYQNGSFLSIEPDGLKDCLED